MVCGGVVVHPGDIVFGDDDGVIVASPTEIAALLPTAEKIVAAEDAMLNAMRKGVRNQRWLHHHSVSLLIRTLLLSALYGISLNNPSKVRARWLQRTI